MAVNAGVGGQAIASTGVPREDEEFVVAEMMDLGLSSHFCPLGWVRYGGVGPEWEQDNVLAYVIWIPVLDIIL